MGVYCLDWYCTESSVWLVGENKLVVLLLSENALNGLMQSIGVLALLHSEYQ